MGEMADWTTDEAMDPDYDDPRDDPNWCDYCWGAGEVPTLDYESYFGAMMKPCPQCHGKLYGTGHGRLS